MRRLLFICMIFLPFLQVTTLKAAFSAGTYYLYEFGNNDYYSKQPGGDGTYTTETKFVFDGKGGFSAETIADSESLDDNFTGTYTAQNGLLSLKVENETFAFRISPDGETLANVTAIQNEDPDIDNESLRIFIKGEEKEKGTILSILMFLLD